MRITVKQLKELIRESVEEVMSEMGHEMEEEKVLEEQDDDLADLDQSLKMATQKPEQGSVATRGAVGTTGMTAARRAQAAQAGQLQGRGTAQPGFARPGAALSVNQQRAAARTRQV